MERTMNNTLAIHGTNADVDAMASRFRIALRGGDKLNNNEARALAQIAIVTRLDPYIGELWYIPGKGPMIGIAGARRLWNEKSIAGGGYSFVELILCSPKEAGATETDVVAAYKAIAHDSQATREYLKLFQDTLNMMRETKAADPFSAAKELVGPKPQWVGYGYSTESESSRMNKTQLARKRAEADALKKCIIVPFGVDVSIEEHNSSYVEAKVTDITEPAQAMTYDQARQVVVKTSRGEKFIGEMDAEQLQKVLENSKTLEHIEAARIVLANDFNMVTE
jgi:hypothetical protein